MTIPVYSFYGEGIEERLREHVKNALETFNENSRLVRCGLRFRESFYEILRYAIILHDFGKVPFNEVAFREVSAKPKAGRLSFEGHEVLSAWFADEYLRRAERGGFWQRYPPVSSRGELKVVDLDRKIVVLAVLLHHHPMDVKSRVERLRKKNLCISESTVKAFYEELGDLVPPLQVPLEGPVCAPDIAEQVLGYYGLFPRYWSDVWMNGKPAERKTLLLAVQGLVAADYNSARRVRGAELSEFARTVDIFLKNWG